METKKNFFEEIGHPSHVSASIKDRKYILDNIFKYGYTDDHDGKNYSKYDMPIHMVGIWTNYRSIQIIPIFEKTTFCCNPFYVAKDGSIHLDTCSCGGTVIGGNLDRYNREMSPNNREGFHTNELIVPYTEEGWKAIRNSKIFSVDEDEEA